MTDSSVRPVSDIKTSPSLLQRARQRDQQAWKKIVELYAPLVFNWGTNFGLCQHDAENVVQEVFTKVSQKLNNFRCDRAKDTFRGWLRVITRNKCIDHIRRQATATRGIGGSDALARMQEETFPSREEDHQEISLLYMRVVELVRSNFSDRDWKAFYEVVVNGQSPREVAESLNVTTNVVYLAKSTILRFIREEYRDLVEGPDGAT